jgi:hypothetical protein
MIVAMAVMRVMKVATNKIVNVVPVRHAFMSTGRTVRVPMIVTLAVMIRRAGIWIEVAH